MNQQEANNPENAILLEDVIEEGPTKQEDILVEVACREIKERLAEIIVGSRHASFDSELSEKDIAEKKLSERAVIELNYVRHNLLLGDILEKVVEKGFKGNVKKKWEIIVDDIQPELSLLDEGTGKAIIKTIESVYQKKAQVEDYLKQTSEQELFATLVGDANEKPRGKILVKMVGDIVAIYMYDRIDFGKSFLSSDAKKMSEPEIAEAGRSCDGFAWEFDVPEKNMKIDIVVFSGRTPGYNVAHEIEHRITDRLFRPELETGEAGYKNPKQYFDQLLQRWTNFTLQDEIVSYMFSALVDQLSSGNEIDGDLVRAHLDVLLKQGDDALYDFPKKEKKQRLIRLAKLFPNESGETLESIYDETCKRYFDIAKEKIDMIYKSFEKIRTLDLCFDFVKLLRFERIEKWHRLIKMLENIGAHSDYLSSVVERQYVTPQTEQDSEAFSMGFFEQKNNLAKGLKLAGWTNFQLKKHVNDAPVFDKD